MANLTESSVYESGVPQLETTTPAIGGAGGSYGGNQAWSGGKGGDGQVVIEY